MPQLVQLAVAICAVFIVIDAIVGERGLFAKVRADHQAEELNTRLTRLKAENAQLKEQAERLKNDPAAIEEVARRELGLIRKGEKVFIIRDLPTSRPAMN